MSSDSKVQALPRMQFVTQGMVDTQRKKVATSSNNASARNTTELKAGKELPGFGEKVPQSAISPPSESHSNDDVLEAVRNLNDFAQNTRRELNFSVDDETGKTVVKVIDFETKEVIRQIPAVEILEVARRINEQSEEKGNLFSGEV
jgi:flagellar protein FlaG